MRNSGLVAILLMLCCACSSEGSKQFLASANDDFAVFVDGVAGTDSNTRTAKVHYVYRTPQPSSSGRYARMTTMEEFDCAKGASRILDVRRYSQSEELLEERPEQDGWEAQDPRKVGGWTLKVACGFAPERALERPISPVNLRSFVLETWASGGTVKPG